MAYKDICLFASHYGTAGAGRNGVYEEPVFAKIVPRAVEILRSQGFDTVYAGGITGHEIDQHSAEPNLYDVTISNHFNVGSAFVIYNPNHNNPNRAKFIAEVDARLQANGISVQAGGYPSDQYAMTNYGKSDNYLIEWANCDKPNELAWIQNIEDRAWDLADFTRKVFLDGEYASSYRGDKPTPTPNPNWTESAIGQRYGEEIVEDAYEETGIFEFTKAPHSLSVYPDYPDAMQNINAYPDIEYNNGEGLTYWAVIRTNKYDYLIYTRDNGKKGVVSIRNKTTGVSYGIAD